MKEKLFGSLLLAACRLKLVARGLPLVACGLQLAARNSLPLGALDKTLRVLRVEPGGIHGKVIRHKFFSVGHTLHS